MAFQKAYYCVVHGTMCKPFQEDRGSNSEGGEVHAFKELVASQGNLANEALRVPGTDRSAW